MPKDKILKKVVEKKKKKKKKGFLSNLIKEVAGNTLHPLQRFSPKNCLSMGVLNFDLVLGGGLRRSRMYMLYGPSSASKSTTIINAIMEAQKKSIPVIHQDYEKASDKDYINTLGFYPETFVLEDGDPGYYYMVPTTGEGGYKALFKILRKLPDIDQWVEGPPTILIVIDSYMSMESEKVTDEKNPMGVKALMHSTYQGRLRSLCLSKGACILATNQLRMSPMSFGSPITIPCGEAIKFYADAIVEMWRRKEKPQGDENVSMVIFRNKVKNRMSKPYLSCEVPLIIGKGFDKDYDRLEFLVAMGEIEKNRGKYLIEEKSLNLGAAKRLMKKPEWIKKALKISRSKEYYLKFWGKKEKTKEVDLSDVVLDEKG